MFGVLNSRILAGRTHLPRHAGIALSLETGKRAAQMHCRRHGGPAVLIWHIWSLVAFLLCPLHAFHPVHLEGLYK